MLNYYQHGTKYEGHRSHSLSTYGTKKIGNFSYSLGDRVGKGFSSIVYRGKN